MHDWTSVRRKIKRKPLTQTPYVRFILFSCRMHRQLCWEAIILESFKFCLGENAAANMYYEAHCTGFTFTWLFRPELSGYPTNQTSTWALNRMYKVTALHH